MDLQEQKKFFNSLIVVLAMTINDIDYEFSKYLGLNINNIFVKEKEGGKISFLFSFAYLNPIPSENLDDPKI